MTDHEGHRKTFTLYLPLPNRTIPRAAHLAGVPHDTINADGGNSLLANRLPQSVSPRKGPRTHRNHLGPTPGRI